MPRSKPQRLGKTYRRRRNSAGLVRTSVTRGGMRASWRIATDLAPSLDAVALVDHVSDVVMAEHWLAIGEGERAEGPVKQPPLHPLGPSGRKAAEGVRPAARGFTGDTTRPFRDYIERAPIKVRARPLRRSRLVSGTRALEGQVFRVNEEVEGTRASTTIRPDKVHRNFLAYELGRGIDYFFVTGYVADAVDQALAKWFELSLEGVAKKADKRDRKAAKAKTK